MTPLSTKFSNLLVVVLAVPIILLALDTDLSVAAAPFNRIQRRSAFLAEDSALEARNLDGHHGSQGPSGEGRFYHHHPEGHGHPGGREHPGAKQHLSESHEISERDFLEHEMDLTQRDPGQWDPKSKLKTVLNFAKHHHHIHNGGDSQNQNERRSEHKKPSRSGDERKPHRGSGGGKGKHNALSGQRPHDDQGHKDVETTEPDPSSAQHQNERRDEHKNPGRGGSEHKPHRGNSHGGNRGGKGRHSSLSGQRPHDSQGHPKAEDDPKNAAATEPDPSSAQLRRRAVPQPPASVHGDTTDHSDPSNEPVRPHVISHEAADPYGGKPDNHHAHYGQLKEGKPNHHTHHRKPEVHEAPGNYPTHHSQLRLHRHHPQGKDTSKPDDTSSSMSHLDAVNPPRIPHAAAQPQRRSFYSYFDLEDLD